MKTIPHNSVPFAFLRLFSLAALLVAMTSEATLRAGTVAPISLQVIGTLGGTIGSATAVNEAGEVVGFANNSLAQQHAFKYSGGGVTDLGNLASGVTSAAYGINASSSVVGYSTFSPPPSTTQHAFQSSGGPMVDLNPSGATSSQQRSFRRA